MSERNNGNHEHGNYLPGHWVLKYSTLIFFLLIALSSSMLAQRVYHVDINNGLCTNSLTDMTLDKKGNLWLGSYGGLMKFSGTHIKCLNAMGNGPNELSALESHSLWEDQCGYIWIGTTGGLDRLDPVTYEITHYEIKPPYAGMTSLGYIYAVFGDSEEFLWISSDAALFKFDPNSGAYWNIEERKDRNGVVSHIVSYNGFVDTDSGVWFHTPDGLTYYEYSSGLFYHRYHNPESKVVFDIKDKETYGHSDMEQDSKGVIWFVNNHDQLAGYNIAANTLDTFSFPRHPGTWPCCYSVAVDARENIWIGTRHGGVFVFDRQTKTFRSLKDQGINRLIQSDYIYNIERGPDGQIFVSHDNGLDIIDLYDVSMQEFKLSGAPDFMNLKHQAGDFMFDETTQSVYIPFYQAGFFKYPLNFESNPGYGSLHDIGSMVCIIFKDDGKLYAGTKGIALPLLETQDTIRLGDKSFLPDTLAALRGQIIWYYRESAESIYLKKNSGQIIHLYQGKLEFMDGFGFKPNMCLSKDSLSLYYITNDLNLVKRTLATRTEDTIDIQTLLSKTSFSFANPRHILDDGSSIWMTGQNGVLRYDYANNSVTGYSMEEGLSHGFTIALVEDKHGDAWVGSLGGIDKYDRTLDKFVSVRKIKEMAYMDSFGHAVCTEDGRLIFHFGNRLFILNVDGLASTPPEPDRMQLNETLVNGRHIDWESDGEMPPLRFNENRITFSYDVLRFIDPALVSFRYRLNGGDWIDNGDRNEVNFDRLASGDYLFEVTTSGPEGDNGADTLAIPFTIKPPFWKTWWFMFMVFVLILIVAWLFFHRHLKHIRAQNKIEIQMAELKATALRVQMNPHFVFNCLNAIQECVVTGRIEEAYAYLSKFSRLLRLVLEHSDQSVITLMQELEILDLYVSLEKLRFKDDMTYSLDIDRDIETEEILIPPMLIQPHIENAIWHGLRNKSGKKQLSILIEEPNPQYIRIIITDNGVGRKKAAEIKAMRIGSGQRHTSKGMAICHQRISLLQKQFPDSRMELIDCYDEDGVATGTKVVLVLPVMPKQ